MSLNKKAISDAVKKAGTESKPRKFTQSVELIVNLRDIDMKSPEGRFQQRIELPNPSPKKPNKICVFASGELALKAKRAKADQVIEKDALQALAGKKKELRKIANEYDFFIAEAPMMSSVGKILGAALGPRGKMPVPVSPSVDIADLIGKYRKMVFVRLRNHPMIRCRVGTEDMDEEKLVENIQAVLAVLERKLKRGIKSIGPSYLKKSMGTPVKIAS